MSLQLGSGAHRLQEPWCAGFVALRHVESSGTRGQTHDPALAGGFLTTGPPGKSSANLFEAVRSGRHGHGASLSTVGFPCFLSLHRSHLTEE